MVYKSHVWRNFQQKIKLYIEIKFSWNDFLSPSNMKEINEELMVSDSIVDIEPKPDFMGFQVPKMIILVKVSGP